MSDPKAEADFSLEIDQDSARKTNLSSNSLDNPPDMDDDVDPNDPHSFPQHVGIVKGSFLVFRSLVGIGILTMGHEHQEFGIYAALVFFPIFAAMILYSLDRLIIIADDIGFDDPRYISHLILE